jgi:hypothetical protein
MCQSESGLFSLNLIHLRNLPSIERLTDRNAPIFCGIPFVKTRTLMLLSLAFPWMLLWVAFDYARFLFNGFFPGPFFSVLPQPSISFSFYSNARSCSWWASSAKAMF